MDGKFLKKKILNLLNYTKNSTDPIVLENEDSSIVVEYFPESLDEELDEYFQVLDQKTGRVFEVDVGSYPEFIDACNEVARIWNKIEKEDL